MADTDLGFFPGGALFVGGAFIGIGATLLHMREVNWMIEHAPAETVLVTTTATVTETATKTVHPDVITVTMEPTPSYTMQTPTDAVSASVLPPLSLPLQLIWNLLLPLVALVFVFRGLFRDRMFDIQAEELISRVLKVVLRIVEATDDANTFNNDSAATNQPATDAVATDAVVADTVAAEAVAMQPEPPVPITFVTQPPAFGTGALNRRNTPFDFVAAQPVLDTPTPTPTPTTSAPEPANPPSTTPSTKPRGPRGPRTNKRGQIRDSELAKRGLTRDDYGAGSSAGAAPGTGLFASLTSNQ
jgi:hypothetical protein